jgi:hypothetical protein
MRPLHRSALLFALLLPAAPTFANDPPRKQSSTPDRGRPTVKLDRLTLPPLRNQSALERHLRQVLKREARRADWGAGRGAVIQYRFNVEELSFSSQSGVLSITCAASGRLPRGKAARSRLVYGGAIAKQDELTRHVLDIVARGVITRLAELERIRRGED